jgi:phage tail sheath protein FI
MGGRTLFGGGGANRYVAMRRSLNYIRKQAEMLTEFALFEVNNQNLWSRLNTTLDVFLNEYRNQGGLRGNIASDAYFIKCDRENNTEASIAAGEVNIEIGVALEYPAEFVVITLTQKTIN